jgi:hypothetical protein
MNRWRVHADISSLSGSDDSRRLAETCRDLVFVEMECVIGHNRLHLVMPGGKDEALRGPAVGIS